MRLGLNLGYWTRDEDAVRFATAEYAEELGLDVVWVAEAHGSDAATVLGHLTARTRRIGLGSATFRIPGRTPTMTAMTAATLDGLSDGRFHLGIGLSAPELSEGWYGVRFTDPLGRTREYVEILRRTWTQQLLEYSGTHWTLPLPDGPGKPQHLALAPQRDRIPIYLGAGGPRNLALTGEIADGWLGLFPAVDDLPDQIAAVAAGRAKAGLDLTGFDVAPSLPLVVGPDTEACADDTRALLAPHVGGPGFGTRNNSYYELAARLGHEREAAAVRRAWSQERYTDAATALPFGFLDAVALLGGRDRIAERLAQYAKVGVTTLNVMVRQRGIEQCRAALRVLVEAAESAGM